MELEFPFNINYTVLKNSIQQTISQTCNFKIGKVPGKIKERKNISCKYAHLQMVSCQQSLVKLYFAVLEELHQQTVSKLIS